MQRDLNVNPLQIIAEILAPQDIILLNRLRIFIIEYYSVQTANSVILTPDAENLLIH